jgi:D-psicose/D-tagatose/L-ribulose 3-epimerase
MATSNPIGVHALVWVGDTTSESVRKAVSQTKKIGFDLLELSLHDARNLDVQNAKRDLGEAGLEIACSRGLTFDADISSDNPDVVAKGSSLLFESLELAHSLGSKILTGVPYSALGKYSGPVTRSGRANVVAVLSDVAKQAGKMNMSIGLEVCNRYETNVINTASDAMRLADDIGSDNVFIHLDTYHMNIEEEDFVAPVLLLGERLGYVHVGENHRGYLGSGHIDFPSFFRALRAVDYRGPITFESFSSSVVSSGLSNDLAVWRNLWSDGEDLAQHAFEYVQQQLYLAGSQG